MVREALILSRVLQIVCEDVDWHHLLSRYPDDAQVQGQ